MASRSLRPGFVAAGFAVALVTAGIVVFVLSQRDFWAELNLFFWAVAGMWTAALWAFLYFGWAIPHEDGLPFSWRPRLRVLDKADLTLLPDDPPDVDGEGVAALIASALAALMVAISLVILLLVAWGVIELVAFLVALALFALVNLVFRRQVVRNRRAAGRLLPSLGRAVLESAVTVGWLPVVVLAVRTWAR